MKHSEPANNIQETKSKLTEIKKHLRSNVGSVDDPQAKALLETSAEVVNGLITAFADYEKKEEEAWK